MEGWEHYYEGSSIGVRGFGGTAAQAFEEAALALTAAVIDPETISPRERVVLHAEAADEDALLAAWLNALLAEMRASGMLFSRFEVWLNGLRLTAHAWGEPLDPERHRPRLHPTRATGETLRVARHADGWLAQALMEIPPGERP